MRDIEEKCSWKIEVIDDRKEVRGRIKLERASDRDRLGVIQNEATLLHKAANMYMGAVK